MKLKEYTIQPSQEAIGAFILSVGMDLMEIAKQNPDKAIYCQLHDDNQMHTGKQRQTYFGVLVNPVAKILVEYYGNEEWLLKDLKTVHEIIKGSAIFKDEWVKKIKVGERYKEIRSTTFLTKEQYSEFIDRIKKWCSQHGVEIILTTSQYDSLLKGIKD